MNELFDIGRECGTDKTSGRMPYLLKYPIYIDHFRDQEISLFEIGVRKGASLKMWERYFPKANIFGLDIDDCVKLTQDRIQVFQGDQSDPVSLWQVCKVGAPFHIIIDDGSHKIDDIKASFVYLFPHLAPGGVYIIEDLYNTYPQMKCGKNKMDQRRADLNGLFNNIIHSVDKSCYEPSIFLAIHFWPGFCVIIRA